MRLLALAVMLASAIEAADWPRALVLAIDEWRVSRAPVLADLVDRIAMRLPAETIRRDRWLQHARVYDPLRVTPLLADATALARKTGVEKNLIDRFGVLATWPHDPRVARVLASWFADANVGFRYSHQAETVAFYQELAEHVAKLQDVRAIPILERALAEPRGKTLGLRDHQRAIAMRAIDVLADTALHAPTLPNAGEIARWCPSPAPVPMSLDERALWREAASADDARLVLADYLLERGDRRGEVITLANAGTDEHTRRASALMHEHWERWMGDLALVLDRGNCSFTGGLLDVACVGIYSTPEWAYPKVARHRELATVRTVRPGWNASEKGYVAFLNALEAVPPRIRLFATMIEPLVLARPAWPVRHLELVTNAPELARLFALAASAMPEVETIDIPLASEINHHVIAAIPTLPDVFPKLARVRIDSSSYLPVELRAALAEHAALPFVEIDDGRDRR